MDALPGVVPFVLPSSHDDHLVCEGTEELFWSLKTLGAFDDPELCVLNKLKEPLLQRKGA